MNQKSRIWIKCVCIHACMLVSSVAFTQCPVNIGFEAGSFANWECSAGSISNTGVITVTTSQPLSGRHTLIQNSFPQVRDFYGDFPVNCPNGSSYSIRLGNNGVGRQAERVSYTFTIPVNDNNYSLIYHYAVVFQNPSHSAWEQPKFTANVFDVSSNDYIGCSSFEYAAASDLPGFKQSTVKDSVFYKPWTPVTIKLSGYAGRTIRLEFTTNDCTRGGHFGYAYVDVNENCTSPVTGNTFCADDDSLSLVAPFGFSEYHWFPADFSSIIGTGNTLTLKPTPTPNTVYAVAVIPFPNQGCLDTIYTTVHFSTEPVKLTVVPKIIACISQPVDLTSSFVTAGSTPGLAYEYYMDSTRTNFIPTPKNITISGKYVIKATNDSGCIAVKQIAVTVGTYPVFSVPFLTDPQTAIRPATIDLASSISSPIQLSFSYWKDTLATLELTNPHAVNKTGIYYIKGTNTEGCTTTAPVSVLIKEPTIIAPNAFTPNGDGFHDEWEIPVLKIYPDCVVEVYNRTGQLMFRSVGYGKPWDGKFNGNALPVGTYYYIIKPSPELPSITGSITIIK